MEYSIILTWDDEAAVWLATSENIRGLALESGSIDALIERVRFAVPELLALNENLDAKSVSLCFRLERHEQVSV
jgi:hypothetical protein